MSKNILKDSEIKFTISLDANNVPEKISWEAEDEGKKSTRESKAIMTSIWDQDDQSTLRIDLWTKDMGVDEMKVFFHQSLLSMADTFEKATGEAALAGDLRDYCAHFGEKMNIIKST